MAERTCDDGGHYPGPRHYVKWHVWAAEMHESGWRQRKCGGCGRWAFWVRPENGLVSGDPHSTGVTA